MCSGCCFDTGRKWGRKTRRDLRGIFISLDLRIVTFSNLIESKDKTEGEMGDLSIKIPKALSRVGSAKEGVVNGLLGEPK